MSYILEALKKAQAERQIGSTPTIHAPTLATAPAGQGASGRRTPVIVAMALMAAAIAGLATMLVRQQPATSQQPAASAPLAVSQSPAVSPPPAASLPTVAAQPPASAAPVAAAPAAGPAAANSNATPVATASGPGRDANNAPAAPAVAVSGATPAAPAAAITAAPAPARPGEAPPAQRAIGQQTSSQRAADAHVAAPSAARAAAAPQLPAQKQAGNGGRGADVTQAGPVAAPPQAPAPVEEQVQSLRELPEPIQRAIPQITLGGYMYSKNPSDRLLLIDKVLRREGEEVAPGLILDKLQPKQAIFSFRGYRYRVPL